MRLGRLRLTPGPLLGVSGLLLILGFLAAYPLAMLLYGIDDIRYFYQNDGRFLKQFA